MAEPRVYCGKALLYGEYTTVLGGSALAVPITTLCSRWSMRQNSRDAQLLGLYDYLTAKSIFADLLDLPRLRSDLLLGWHLESEIPHGYGAGSSGSVVAAVYDRYHRKVIGDIDELLTVFANIESYYHGSSSGMDALVSYVVTPTSKIDNKVQMWSEAFASLIGVAVYLVDTGTARSTATLVSNFMSQLQCDDKFANHVSQMRQIADQCVATVVGLEAGNLLALTSTLSKLQFKAMPHCIPAQLRDPWSQTLEREDVSFKLCGAGGGGYLMIVCASESIDVATITQMPTLRVI